MVLALHGKVIAITALAIPVTVVWLIPTIWLIHRSAPELRFGFRGASRAHARQVLLFGSALFGIQSAAVVKLQSDEIVIGAALPVSNISPYAVARRLSTLPGQLTSQFVLVLLPIASRLHAEGEAGLLRQIYLTGLRLTLALFAIVGGALIIFAKPFLLAWAPSVAGSADIVVLLTFAAVLEALISPVSQALQGMNRHRPLVVFSLGSAALNLALSIALVGPLGVRGVAIGTLVATFLEALVTLPFGARVLGVAAGRDRQAGGPARARCRCCRWWPCCWRSAARLRPRRSSRSRSPASPGRSSTSRSTSSFPRRPASGSSHGAC